MTCRIVYYHRIHFPNASAQTIAVIRDYHALARIFGDVHILYRAPKPLSEHQMEEALSIYGIRTSKEFQMHCITEGPFGKTRLKRKVKTLIRSSPSPVAITGRTVGHAGIAIRLRDRLQAKKIAAVTELHQMGLPHMVHREAGKPIKAFRSILKERRVFPKLDGIVCTAPPQLPLLDQKFPNHAPALVLSNAYDANLFISASGRLPNPDRFGFHLRYAGAFSKWKNTDIMIEALQYLPEHVVLDIAGGNLNNTESTRKTLLEKGAKFGVDNRIHYAGFLPPTEIPAFLAGADCLLLPLGNTLEARLFTSPMKLFDYAASGVPIVAARQPSVTSLIDEGVHALMAAHDSPREIADAVLRLMADPAYARNLACNAGEWVKKHTTAKRAAEYRNFLMNLLNKS